MSLVAGHSAAEYIGLRALKVPVTPLPINRDIGSFRYLLAFARDYDGADRPTNGHFIPHWDKIALDKGTIKDIKRQNPNVRVVVSIGGRGQKYPFKVDPNNPNPWIDNATKSLQQIISDYDLDGIDVHYDSIFSSDLKPDNFAEYLGTVILNLKKNLSAKALTISISPLAGALFNYYDTFLLKYGEHIDWVHYQFYSHPLHTQDAFVKLFNELVQGQEPYNKHPIPREKLLAGFSTDENDQRNLPKKVFTDGIQALQGKLVGTFVLNTGDSLINY